MQAESPNAEAPNSKDGNILSHSRRKRPRKLKASESSLSKPHARDQADTVIQTEISALKFRIEDIESRMQLIQQRSERKTPRRRTGKKRNTDQTDEEQWERVEADEEGALLEKDLVVAKKELEESRLRLRMTSERRNSDPLTEVDDVEEISREPQSVGRAGVNRAVTIAGSYRFPISNRVSDGDLEAVRNGLKSFQNIARGYVEDADRSNRGIGALCQLYSV
jgi:hypothetical protein